MACSSLRAGDRVGPFPLTINPDIVRAFGRTTRDMNPQVMAGRLVPPSLIASLAYAAQMAAITELVPESVFSAARGGVHGEHDVVVHKPIPPDAELHSFVETHSARPSGRNLRITLHHTLFDVHGDLAADQWWTTVLLGTTSGETGSTTPDYSFTGDEAGAAMAERTIPIDDEMARQYADVSGDRSEHHFTAEGARRSGYDRPFLHGLCTMALCMRAVAEAVAEGDPSRIRRLAVRFATPAFLGNDLVVRTYRRPAGGFALEAGCGTDMTIRNGYVELIP